MCHLISAQWEGVWNSFPIGTGILGKFPAFWYGFWGTIFCTKDKHTHTHIPVKFRIPCAWDVMEIQPEKTSWGMILPSTCGPSDVYLQSAKLNICAAKKSFAYICSSKWETVCTVCKKSMIFWYRPLTCSLLFPGVCTIAMWLCILRCNKLRLYTGYPLFPGENEVDSPALHDGWRFCKMEALSNYMNIWEVQEYLKHLHS